MYTFFLQLLSYICFFSQL